VLKNIKVSIFIVFFYSMNLLSQEITVVPMAVKTISYKAKIYSSDFKLIQTKDTKICKKYLDIKTLKEGKYFAKRYIAKGKPLCEGNVFVPTQNKIKFKFGNLEIERDGKIIRETNEYIKIKNLDGTIDKIFKDGTNR